MSEKIDSILIGKIKVLLKQPNLAMRRINGTNTGGYQEYGDEILKEGKTSVLKRLIQTDKTGKFNCLVLELDGKRYVGDHEQFLTIEDLLAPIKCYTLDLERKSTSTQR